MLSCMSYSAQVMNWLNLPHVLKYMNNTDKFAYEKL